MLELDWAWWYDPVLPESPCLTDRRPTFRLRLCDGLGLQPALVPILFAWGSRPWIHPVDTVNLREYLAVASKRKGEMVTARATKV